jgi:hypothetical protein
LQASIILEIKRPQPNRLQIKGRQAFREVDRRHVGSPL